MTKLWHYLNGAYLRALLRLQAFSAQEPVRLRAALTSIALIAALYVPGVVSADLADEIGVVGAVVLPIVVGESARKKVTPVK